MSTVRRLGAKSTVYTGATLVQKALALVLLPLYTRVLTAEDYGTLAVVTSVGMILSVIFSLGLNAALSRLYVEVRDDEETRKRFLGTIVVFLTLVSFGATGLLALFGAPLFRAGLGGIDFFPFVALGLVASAFHPVFDVFLIYLQTTERAMRFGVLSLLSFLLKVILTIVLVVAIPLGAAGALAAQAIVSVLAFFVALWFLRHDLTLTIDRAILRRTLSYGRAVLPHAIAFNAKGVLDKLFLNHFAGASAAGVYNIGFQLASVVQVVVVSVNRALLPVFVNAIHSGGQARGDEMRVIGRLLASGYCFLALTVATFAPEAVRLLIGPGFQGADRVIPLLAFAFAALGVQAIFVRELLYTSRNARWISITGVGSLIVATVLNLLLIPTYGMAGAAVASLVSQVAQATVLGWVSTRVDLVRWDIAQFGAVFIATFALANATPLIVMPSALGTIAVKLAFVLVTGQVLLAINGGRALFGHPALKGLSWIR